MLLPLRLTNQALGLHGCMHRRTCRHAGAKCGDVGKAGDVYLDSGGLVRHGEQVGVGHAEVLAHQVIFAGQLLVGPFQARHQLACDDDLEVGRCGGIEQRRSNKPCCVAAARSVNLLFN